MKSRACAGFTVFLFQIICYISFIYFTVCTTRHRRNLLLFFALVLEGKSLESSMCWTLWMTGLPICKAFYKQLQSRIMIVIILYFFLSVFFLKTTLWKMCEIEIIVIPAYTLGILAVLPFKWIQRHLPLTFHASLIQTLSISPRWPMSFCCQSTFCRDPYVSKCVCADTCEMQGFV